MGIDDMMAARRAVGIRFGALAFGAAALGLPFAMYRAGFLSSSGADGCQSPTAAIESLLTATTLTAVLATTGLILAALAFRRLPAPRSIIRKLELALCCLPLTLVVVFFLALIFVFTAG